MTDHEMLELLVQKVTGMEQKVIEHGEILQAVRHAQEIQVAKIDKLEIETARLSGKIEGLSTDINYLVRKSAQNADDIQELRQAR
jgi:hypothetical protein